jgi:butyrate kinase
MGGGISVGAHDHGRTCRREQRARRPGPLLPRTGGIASFRRARADGL